jgi:putative transposase
MLRTHILPCALLRAEADALNRESGRIYTRTLITHYRVYRKSKTRTRHWLSPHAGQRLNDYLTRDDPALLHALSKDAAQQGFYAACKVAKETRHLGANYPHRRKQYRTTVWKSTGIRRQGTLLLLARARGLAPLHVALPVSLQLSTIKEARLVWDRAGRRYQWHLVVEDGRAPAPPPGNAVVAVDLGEVHPAACTDGLVGLIVSCRLLRATRQFTAKRRVRLQQRQSRTVKHSRRWRRLQRVKNRFRACQQRRLRDYEHKVSRAVVDFASTQQAGTLAIGDVRDIADGTNRGHIQNQRLSTWWHGKLRQYLQYKAEGAGMRVILVNEAYSSQTCPSCGHRSKPQGRVYRCPACGLVVHRDVVGAVNLLSRHVHGDVGQIRPPPETMYRRPVVCRRRRSRPDTGLPSSAVAWGTPQEAAGP